MGWYIVTAMAGRSKKLTPAIAKDLEALWALGGENTLTDAEIAARLGIGADRLRGWVFRNSKVITGYNEDGTEKKSGIRDIRTRARGQTKSSYLQRLYNITLEAEKEKEYRVASANIMWLLEKMFPLEFGNRVKIEGAGDTGMSDEEAKKIQDELRERIVAPV